jgi:hypothetical protein
VARAGAGLPLGSLRGAIDRIVAPWTIEGWADDADHPELPALLELLLEDQVIDTVLACDYRRDLDKAGIGRGNCAFFVTSPVWLPPESLGTLRIRRVADHAEIRMTAACIKGIEAGRETWASQGSRLVA